MRDFHPWRGGVGIGIVLATCLLGPPVAAQTSTSAPLVEKLVAFMTAQKLQAFSAKDPADPNRYVAALFYPGSQLLVVAGNPSLPALAQHQFEQAQHSTLYATLHQSASPDTRLFVHDMNADGLRAREKDSTDIVYDRVVNQILFDGSPGKRRQSDQEYERQFIEADDKYSRMLQVLLGGAASAAGKQVAPTAN